METGRHGQVDVGAEAEHEAEHLAERLLFALHVRRIETAAFGLADRESDDRREHQARGSDDEERGAPADQLAEVPTDEEPR